MASSHDAEPRGRGEVAILGAILAVALVVRAWGASFGLPHLYYWDEPTVVNRAVRFASGDLNPHFFYYPALYMYVLFVVGGAYYAVARLTGHVASVGDFAVEYFTRPSAVYLCARITTALIGVAGVLVTYAVGRRFFGKRVGLVAAAIVAVSVLHASYAHVAITDVPHALFIGAAYLPIHRVLTRSRPRDYALAGALIGLGAATKYLAVLLVPTLVLAHVLREEEGTRPAWSLGELARDAIDRRLLLAAAAVVVAFFVASPFNVLDFRAFLADYATQAALSTGGGEAHPAWFFARVLWLDLGAAVCVAAAIGAFVLARRRGRAELVFASFPIVYFLFASRVPRVFARYMIPEDGFCAIVAALGLVALVDALLKKRREPALALATALACVAPAARLVGWDALMARTVDTRTRAAEWAESTLPAGTSVAIEPLYDRTFFNAPLETDASLAKLDREFASAGRLAVVQERVDAEMRRRPVFTLAPWADDLDALEREGARYVFVSDLCGPLPAAFEEQLSSRARVAAVFAPDAALARDVPSWPDVVPVVPPRITVYALP